MSAGCGCGTNTRTVYPPTENICDAPLFNAGEVPVTADDLCNLQLIVCVNGENQILTGAQLMSALADAITINYGDEVITFTADGCRIVAILPMPCLMDSDGQIIVPDENGCWTLPAIPEYCLVDADGVEVPVDADGCWVLPAVPEYCLVDSEGEEVPVDADGCWVLPDICLVDHNGEPWTKNEDGCWEPPPLPVCGPLGFANLQPEIGETTPLQIDLNDYFELNADDTGLLSFTVHEDSAQGITIRSIVNGDTVNIQSDRSSCAWSFDVTPICSPPDGGANVPYGRATISGTHAAGSVVFGPSLMNMDDFNSAVEGPVAPGNEFAPGWSNPTLGYDFNTYPNDTSIAIMEGEYNGLQDLIDQGLDPDTYNGDGRRFVHQVPFPGDLDYGIPATDRWFYANGNTTGAPYIIAERTITGITPGATYELVAYTSNAIAPDETFGDAPQTQFRIDGVPIGDPIPVPYHSSAHGGVDVWERHTRRWTAPAGTTSAVFSVYDAATGANGDDFAMVVVGMQEVITC